MACVGRRGQLVAIHREIGLAGYVTCESFSVQHRRDLVAVAATRLGDDTAPGSEPLAAEFPEIGRALAKMFSETISASDALAGELAAHDVNAAQRDRLHLIHAHVMSACELLDERLTVLELENAGIDAAG
jgi:hypothetical protein